MRKWLILAIVMLASTRCSYTHAQEFDVNEARSAIVKYKIVSVELNFQEKIAVANIVLLDSGNNIVGQTAISATGAQFDGLLTTITLDKPALTQAIKTKLGK